MGPTTNLKRPTTGAISLLEKIIKNVCFKLSHYSLLYFNMWSKHLKKFVNISKKKNRRDHLEFEEAKCQWIDSDFSFIYKVFIIIICIQVAYFIPFG